MPKRAAVYARISRDRTGAEAGVRRQERDCRELVESRGWELAEVYVDDDTSAYSGRARPAFDRLMEAVEAGMVDVVVAWHPDRLTRSPRELEDLIDTLETSHTKVETVRAGRWDLSTRSGRTTARLIGAVARDESEAKAERLHAMHADRRRRGLYWGGPRPYGYRPDDEGGLVIVEDEARIVHEAAARVLAGEWVGQVAADFNHREVPTARGGRWQVETLRRMLTSDTVAGRRGDQSAAWPAVLDDTTWRQLRAVLYDKSRARGTVARVALLAGMARCASCGATLMTQRRANGVRVYVCPARSLGGCGGVHVVAEPLERHVEAAVLAELNRPEFLAELAGDGDGRRDKLTAELEAIDAKRTELAELWASGELGAADWTTAGRRLDATEAELRAELARVPAPIELDPRLVAEGWEAMTLGEQRAILNMFVVAVTVHPALRRGRGFDPRRCDPTHDIEWRRG
jgi:site-specific DNA recombinase